METRFSAVFIHREADRNVLGPDAESDFCDFLLAKLQGLDVDGCVEPRGRPQSEAMRQIRQSQLCVFLLSNSFFYDERSKELMLLAIEQDKVMLLVVLPNQKWGAQRDGPRNATFPENAFNPSWTPFMPEMKPAFSDIAVIWHKDHDTASLSQFLRRTNTIYKHVNRGASLYDAHTVHMKLVQAEEDELENVRISTPPGGPMVWDWNHKVYDMFLSHKITDAKDIVLTWYNAMSATGFYPFLDRINLDRVDNIPLFVEQTCNFIIAITKNLYVSYWCMVELKNAVDLHAKQKIKILLVPIEGEQWPATPDDPDADLVDWPPVPEVCKNLFKWFPEMRAMQDAEGAAKPDTTLWRIEQLYSYGTFTQERLVHHTLIHYKSFERMLLTRCGVSIAAHKKLEEIAANGGTSLSEKAAGLYALVAEANALHKQMGVETTFEVHYAHHLAELSVNEMLNDKIRTAHTPKQFLKTVMVLRSETDHLRATATAMSSQLLEQWQLIASMEQETADMVSDEVAMQLVELARSTQQVIKVLIGFFQVNTSFLHIFPTVTINWPVSFSQLMSPFLVILEPIAAFMDSFSMMLTTFDYERTTYVFLTASVSLLVSFMLIHEITTRLVCRKRMSARHTDLFFDYTIFASVLVVFLLYPSLSARTFQLFQYNAIGEELLLAVDMRLGYEEMRTARLVGMVFVIGFVLGVPVSVWLVLNNAAGPNRRKADTQLHMLTEERVEADRRYARRYGMFYSKYRSACWWWEVFDLVRKLLLTAVLVFIATGSVLQVWVGIFISLFSLMMTVQFRPFVSWQLDVLAVTSQLCTLLTLIASLGFHKDGAESGLKSLAPWILPAILITCQIAPTAVGVWVSCAFVRQIYNTRRSRKKQLAAAPAAMKDDHPHHYWWSETRRFSVFLHSGNLDHGHHVRDMLHLLHLDEATSSARARRSSIYGGAVRVGHWMKRATAWGSEEDDDGESVLTAQAREREEEHRRSDALEEMELEEENEITREVESATTAGKHVPDGVAADGGAPAKDKPPKVGDEPLKSSSSLLVGGLRGLLFSSAGARSSVASSEASSSSRRQPQVVGTRAKGARAALPGGRVLPGMIDAVTVAAAAAGASITYKSRPAKSRLDKRDGLADRRASFVETPVISMGRAKRLSAEAAPATRPSVTAEAAQDPQAEASLTVKAVTLTRSESSARLASARRVGGGGGGGDGGGSSDGLSGVGLSGADGSTKASPTNAVVVAALDADDDGRDGDSGDEASGSHEDTASGTSSDPTPPDGVSDGSWERGDGGSDSSGERLGDGSEGSGKHSEGGSSGEHREGGSSGEHSEEASEKAPAAAPSKPDASSSSVEPSRDSKSPRDSKRRLDFDLGLQGDSSRNSEGGAAVGGAPPAEPREMETQPTPIPTQLPSPPQPPPSPRPPPSPPHTPGSKWDALGVGLRG